MIFDHLWATEESAALFEDAGRTRSWLDVYSALAEAQAELGLIPSAAAHEIAAHAAAPLDVGAVASETRRSGHSTLGLIRVLQRELGAQAREWVSFGATVQDVTDTWTGLVMQRMLAIADRDLAAIEASLTALADRHRATVMLGRTHGQPGLPITFGFKAAGWTAEVARHRARIEQARPRLEVGQLAGAVGTKSAWGDRGVELERRVMERLGLGVPEIGWLTARDRVAEFVALLAMITGTLARIGNEVYNLQRAEIGELSEAPREGVVGSITMAQKRNPERSEHLSTLARLVRAAAGLALEGMIGEHERDGAAWKTEWSFLPQASNATAAALELEAELVAGLEVHADRMRANVEAQRGYVLAEPVTLALGESVGPRRAHELVHAAAQRGQSEGLSFREALATVDLDLDALLRPEAALGAVDEIIDRALGR